MIPSEASIRRPESNQRAKDDVEAMMSVIRVSRRGNISCYSQWNDGEDEEIYWRGSGLGAEDAGERHRGSALGGVVV